MLPFSIKYEKVREHSAATISLSDLKNYLKNVLEENHLRIDEEILFEIINAVACDFFVTIPHEEAGYLGYTLTVLFSINIEQNFAFNLAQSLYNHFTFIIDTFRLSENIDFIDKTTCEIVSSDLMILKYDSTKP